MSASRRVASLTATARSPTMALKSRPIADARASLRSALSPAVMVFDEVASSREIATTVGSGRGVDCSVGTGVGCKLGTGEGCKVGTGVGCKVGTGVGWRVGTGVGCGVGTGV